ncbi:prolyl oligopeptidase family serine peptidase [Ramlibacter algicola]|uniref:S9 family peptidase n=1 Tax=Ramlibacter algicola TaxID=2795217 RepID=A0A934UQP5_9BURK|nr:prolyl oligopeptidase family serine peptidase [Ramlibacter algicola]MBK0392335.1 S9 family peptidase [Ramlibacter algicola]
MTDSNSTENDPFLWLEDVEGERALTWVRERNAVTEAILMKRPGFAESEKRLLSILEAKDRIPYIVRRGAYVYNFWTDDEHPRGLWRRTSLDDYRNPQPTWDVVLDVDALGKAEGVSWVWAGAAAVPARTEAEIDRALISLSRGGSDAHVVREFDLVAKRFVDGGFQLEEAKSDVAWLDRDTLYVATDFGPGSMTDSGYPRIVKRWKRGTPLASATTVYEGKKSDVSASVHVEHLPGGAHRAFVSRSIDFYRDESHLLLADGRLQRIDKPEDCDLDTEGDVLLLQPRSDWTVGGATYKAGTLLATSFDAYLRGERKFDVLFTPTPSRSLERGGYSFTRSHVLLNILDDVSSRIEEWHRDASGRWQGRTLDLPRAATAWVAPLKEEGLDVDPLADLYFIGYEDFLTPDRVLLAKAGDGAPTLLRQAPARFDSAGMRAEQRFATSKDGTRVPYFVVWPRGAQAGTPLPTLLYGYGGFQVNMQPSYQSLRGGQWLERGGVLVIANIRGGGEYGPEWHQAAILEHKQRSYDDFIAVAEDLVAQRITTPKQLGTMGGSNGGLLMGAMLTQRPDLFGAIVCQVPLLDMRRFHKLLAGASWMAEYGDPDDPKQWAFISKYSPYQNVKRGVQYPRVLFTTSTRDDRVHPGHARKMAAKLLSMGHDLLYYENIEGGHGGAADAKQEAHIDALEYAYLWMQLGGR